MTIAAVAGGLAGAIGGLGGNTKDPERLARNAAAYSLALQGNEAALTFLGCMAGILPRQNVPGYGDCGGWATDTAKKDAAAKYNAVVAQSKGMTLAVPTPEPGLIDKLQTVAQGVAREIGDAAGSAAAGGPAGQAAAEAAGTAKMVLTLLAVVAVGAVAFYVYKNR